MRRVGMVFVVMLLLVPTAAWSQSAAILGTVTDASGGTLPGVLVEASSPALIEGVRTAVTDERGLYRIIELRPGTYRVTFTMSGFRTEQREGVQLTTGFTATVNAALALGGVSEEVTVTQQATEVDTVSTSVQTVVSQVTLNALPLGQNLGMMRSLTVGATAAATAQDVGGNQGEATQGFSIHGSKGGDFQQYRDGMLTNSLIAAGNWLSSQNPSTIQEVVVSTGGFGAQAQTGGGTVNLVQREGGNQFTGNFQFDFANKRMQKGNIDEALENRGATNELEIRQRYDVGGGFGGPIVRNKLWFFQGNRYWTTSSRMPNNYFNATQGTLFYTPDQSRPAYDLQYYAESNTKLTWQAAQDHKVTFTYVRERNCNCFFTIGSGTIAPEAAGSNLYTPNYRIQATWTHPMTNNLLLWAGMTHQSIRATNMTEGEGREEHRSVLEQSTGYRYGARGTGLAVNNSWGHQDNLQANQNFTVSYMFGGHLLKVGFMTMQARQERVSRLAPDGMTFRFNNQVPNQITLWATPYGFITKVFYSSFFVEDQWTMSRLTLNLGLRYDGMRGSAPAQHLDAGPWVPERNFDAVKGSPSFNDFNPRLGVAYDLFGTGRTALKGSISRTVTFQAPGGLTQQSNPVNSMVTSATRNWTDDGDFVPEENELGPLSNSNFGRVIQTTFWDDDVISGWHNREYGWAAAVSLQHQVARNIVADFSYHRTWYGNSTVTRNRAVSASDYDHYCVITPVDSRLPAGIGGQEICGLYDLNPTKFGAQDSLNMRTSKFGKAIDRYNGISANVNAQFGEFTLGGGVSSGSQLTDNCYVVNSPQMYQCRNKSAWYGATQLKAHVVAPLPWELQASAVYQMLPSIPYTANWTYGNAQVIGLGRPLSGGGNPTRSINLLESSRYFREGLNQQLDLRFTRTFRLPSGFRIQPELSVFNALNANSVLGVNNTFGNSWQNVTSVLGSRVVKLGAQVSF